MESKIGKINIGLVLTWLLVFNWHGGWGINIEVWLLVLVGLLWVAFARHRKLTFPILVVLFFINLHINKLFGINDWHLNFDFEKINLSNPEYLKIIDKYRLNDVWTPYRLRTWFYQGWMNIFLWIDSVFKILSPIFWVRLMGFGGSTVFFVGLVDFLKNKSNLKYIWWMVAVVLSSGLGIQLDTRTEIVLALPVLILIMAGGLNNGWVRKKWWLVGLLVFVDLILK